MNQDSFIFKKYLPTLGTFSLRPFQIPQDIAVIYAWVTQEYAKCWGLLGCSMADVEQAYREISAQASIYLGYCNGQAVFLAECYDPKQHEVSEHYLWQAGDRGMHILIAPSEHPITHFTWAAFTVLMDFMFSNPAVRRIVVEPDITNEKIHALNERAGFQYQKVIQLSNKTAHLAFCTKESYQAALRNHAVTTSPKQVVAHLQAGLWAKVNRLHLCKAISEFAHELLIQPELESTAAGWGHYVLRTDNHAIDYRFRAQRLSLDHWFIDKNSLQKWLDGKLADLDSLTFILEIRSRLAIDPAILPTYMEEINSTLYGSAYKHCKKTATVVELIAADFQTVEAAMMEGHPAFLANNGRIGFDANDYYAYAPEAAAPIQLVWLAVHKSKATFACADDVSYSQLLAQELGLAVIAKFTQILAARGLNSDDYWLMPAHPWQWYNKLVVVFAADIATSYIVCLGYGEDTYQAQQSIRTFFNTDHPDKYYVKTALSILNMGFMRGLSPYYMSTTPAINDCIHGLIEQDPYLSTKGFSILREVAAIGYRHTVYETAISTDSPYKKMLAALWRESPIPQLKPGQRVLTMAALLHIDAHGAALLPALINASGLSTANWLRHYLDCYLSPLLHCFYTYDLVFMPHGENLMLVLENSVPVRAIMKDIAEEVAIMNKDIILSEKVQRLSVFVPEELKTLSILTDVFDLIFRYISAILLEYQDYSESEFWQLVADCVLEYQRNHPHLADKFKKYDLFAPEFIRSCLNRLQLGNNQQMIDLADPAKNLKFVGTLKNPIAIFNTPIKTGRAEMTAV